MCLGERERQREREVKTKETEKRNAVMIWKAGEESYLILSIQTEK